MACPRRGQLYVGVHFPITIAFLLWLWWRHHDRYARVRTTLAITTGVALLIMAFVPLAPPRLFSGDGLLDTMQTYGPSAYSTNTTAGLANQFAAMPSLHIAWSVLIAVTVVLVSTRRWRWVVVAHPVVTTVVVVATANHYWADGLELTRSGGHRVFGDGHAARPTVAAQRFSKVTGGMLPIEVCLRCRL